MSKTVNQAVAISPPKFETAVFNIEGTAPYMQNRFSQKAEEQMRAKQQAGQSAKKGKAKEPRDFDRDFQEAQHIATEGWIGIPAIAFRNACIDVCRMTGFKMTHSKMSLFVEADGLDRRDGTPLIKIIGDKPEKSEMPVRNATGVADIRVRPMWRKWCAQVRIRYDADQLSLSDVTNLLARAGMQVGIGEGRPFSKTSNGIGFGLFKLV